MNRELIHIIEQMSKERGIPKESILGTLESALLSAVRKKYGIEPEVKITIDDESGEIAISALKKIVKKVADPTSEISLKDAQKIDPSKQLDENIDSPLAIENFGRIAAQCRHGISHHRKVDYGRDACEILQDDSSRRAPCFYWP